MNQLPDSPLFTPEGATTDKFAELLTLFGIDQRDVQGVYDVTQRDWYQGGKFRYEMIDDTHADKKVPAMQLLRELGFVDAIQAVEGRQHKYMHQLGATVVAVRKRLALAKKQWIERGVRFDSVELLGATQRPLTGPNEALDKLYDGTNADLPFDAVTVGSLGEPKNEAEMMDLQAKLAERLLPWTSVVPTRLTSTPAQEGRNTNVADTVKAWLDQYQPKPGKVLAVSSQPYTSYQGLAIANTLGEGWEVEAIGYEAPAAIKVSGYLDNTAKLVYELIKATRSA
jgi:hypothetical protein